MSTPRSRRIQAGGPLRSPGVTSFAGEQQQWVVQPLIDAGVSVDRIHELVFDLAFADLVSEGRDTLTAVSALVAGHSEAVRVAWAQTIARLLVLELPA
jgi:kynureninase